MEDEVQRICIVDTTYTLFLYFLLKKYDENDIFIFSKGIPKQIRDNINHIYFPFFNFTFDLNTPSKFVRGILKNIRSAFIYIFSFISLKIKLFFKTKNKIVKVYGHGHLFFSFPLYEYENSYIIEDGLANYGNLVKTRPLNPLVKKFLHFFGVNIFSIWEGFGTHENIKKVYLTKQDAPEIIKHKVEIFNPDELWDSFSVDEKNKIYQIFNIEDYSELNNAILLLTEPFFESGYITLEEEIEIYSDIISKYDSVIIKPHPREVKCYNEIFPNTKVINQHFPIEILKYAGLKFDKIITIGSTAALNFKNDCEIEIWNGKTSSKEINDSIVLLKEKFLD